MDWDIVNGKNVVDDSLIVRKAVWRIKCIIAIGHTVPTEIEMKFPVVVVTVADESVSSKA